MPKRKPGWVPALTHRKREARGRVRVPDKGDVYLGRPGDWPARQKRPPDAIRQQYEKEIAEWMARRAAGPVAPRSGPATVNELLLAYQQYADRYYRKEGQPTSELRAVAQTGKRLRLLWGSEPANDMTPPRLRQLMRVLAADCCRRTVNYYVERVKRIWGWAVEQGFVRAEVWYALKAVKGLPANRGLAPERAPVKPVPEEWIERTVACLDARTVAVLRVQLLTGMRPNEVVSVRLSCIDRTAAVWKYTVPPAANKLHWRGVERIVFLGPKCQKILRPYVRAAERAGRDAVFVTKFGTPMRRYLYTHLVNNAAHRAGLPAWGPNRLRHNAATTIRALYGLETAQAVLGHREVRTTQIYAEKNEELARRAAREQS